MIYVHRRRTDWMINNQEWDSLELNFKWSTQKMRLWEKNLKRWSVRWPSQDRSRKNQLTKWKIRAHRCNSNFLMMRGNCNNWEMNFLRQIKTWQKCGKICKNRPKRDRKREQPSKNVWIVLLKTWVCFKIKNLVPYSIPFHLYLQI